MVVCLDMGRHISRRLDNGSRLEAEYLLLHHWKPSAVAYELHCHQATIDRLEKRIQTRESAEPPPGKPPGRPGIPEAAVESLFEYQRQHPYLFKHELLKFLEEEWKVKVHKSTIFRQFKKKNIVSKKGQLLHKRANQSLRTAFQAQMLELLAEQLVFIDESLFKERGCWRMMACAPIGEPARWQDEARRGEIQHIKPLTGIHH